MEPGNLARKDRKNKKNSHKGKPYEHPIPGPNRIIDFLQEIGRPVKPDAILAAFSLKGQRMRALLVDRL